MADVTESASIQCVNCGRASEPGDDWGRTEHPSLGELTQCPDCGSTNIQRRR